MTRQEANLEIAEWITSMILMYPDLRFGQIMATIDLIKYESSQVPGEVLTIRDEYYLESEALLKRIIEATDKLSAQQQTQRENV